MSAAAIKYDRGMGRWERRQIPPRAWLPRQGSLSSEIAFERWVNETSQPDLPRLIRESLDELKAVTAGK